MHADAKEAIPVLRVMCVEDDPMQQQVLSLLFDQANQLNAGLVAFDLKMVSSGYEALELSQGRWHLILVDYVLGDMTGDCLIAALHRMLGDSATIVMTSVMPVDEVAFGCGADLFLPKPLGMNIVQNIWQQIKDRSELHKISKASKQMESLSANPEWVHHGELPIGSSALPSPQLPTSTPARAELARAAAPTSTYRAEFGPQMPRRLRNAPVTEAESERMEMERRAGVFDSMLLRDNLAHPLLPLPDPQSVPHSPSPPSLLARPILPPTPLVLQPGVLASDGRADSSQSTACAMASASAASAWSAHATGPPPACTVLDSLADGSDETADCDCQ